MNFSYVSTHPSSISPSTLKAVEPLVRPRCQYGHNPFVNSCSFLITQCSDDLPLDNMLSKHSLCSVVGRFHIQHFSTADSVQNFFIIRSPPRFRPGGVCAFSWMASRFSSSSMRALMILTSSLRTFHPLR